MPYNLTLGNRLITIHAPLGQPDITDISKAIETAVFNSTNLAKLRVRSALINNIDIWDALLSEASFFSCTLTNCDFRKANLMDASIADSKIENCTFNEGGLQRFRGYSSIFKRVHFKNVQANYANFEHSTFENCSFRKGMFEYGNFFRVTMNHCDLRDVSLYGTVGGTVGHSSAITNCRFDNSNLKDADFRNSIFTNCSFKNCIMTNTNLRGCNFTNCDFTNVLLDSVFLERATWDSKTGEFLDKLKPVPKLEKLPLEPALPGPGTVSFQFNDNFSYASSQAHQNLLTSSTGNSVIFYPRRNYSTTFSYGRTLEQVLDQVVGTAGPAEPIPDIDLDENE